MTLITTKLTIPEAELLITLVNDQLFRREFIDPKMPGHKEKPGEVALGKSLVSRLRDLVDEGTGRKRLLTRSTR